MSMRLTTKLALCAVVVMTTLSVSAREDDEVGLWTSAGVEKELGYGVKGSFEGEYRTKGNHFDRFGLGISASRSVYSNDDNTFSLKAGIGYKYTRNFSLAEKEWKGINSFIYDNAYWRNRHRINLQLTAKQDLGRWTLSLRERYQFAYSAKAKYTRDKYEVITGTREEVLVSSKEKIKGIQNEHLARTAFEASYDIRNCKLTPFAGIELYNNLSDKMNLEKTRYTAGCNWKITDIHSVQGAFIWQDRAADGELSGGAIKLSYNYKF